MYSTLIEALRQWNKTNDRHAKLQHIYLSLALIILVLAGLIGLVNYGLGQSLLFLSTVALLIFIANAIVWALADSFIVARLTKRPTSRK